MLCNTRYSTSQLFDLIHQLYVFSYNVRHRKIQRCYLIKLSRLTTLSSRNIPSFFIWVDKVDSYAR
nr:MAG TPA: hypothetical protein [Caudoviricetes sp.]